LAKDGRDDLVLTLVFRAGHEYRFGQVHENDVLYLEQFPARALAAFATAGKLVAAHDLVAFPVFAINVGLDYPGITVIPEFKHPFFLDRLANRRVHLVSLVIRDCNMTVKAGPVFTARIAVSFIVQCIWFLNLRRGMFVAAPA
jgi:hypothetical protein